MARLQTTTEALSLEEGRRQSKPWTYRLVEPVSSSPQAIAKGNLLVLLELGGNQAASSRLYRLLLNTVQGVYYDSAGGISGGLTEALTAAHRALVDHNLLYPAEDQRAGVSCVVLRGEELYLGVGGPAMILVGHPGRVEQFPAELSPNVIPIGGPEPPSIEIFRTSVPDRALVTQLQSDWVARVPSRTLAAAGLAPDLPTALEYLEEVAPEEGSLTALVSYLSPRPLDQQPPGPAAATEAAEMAVAGGDAEAATEAIDQEAPTESVDYGDAAAWPPEMAVVPATEVKPRRRIPWYLLLLIPVVVTLAIALAYWWQQRAVQQEVETLLQGAQAALDAATAEGVPEDVAREQLLDAEERLQQVSAVQPANAEAATVQTSVQQALDALNRVVPLYKLITLREFGGPGTDPARVVVQGNRVYVLDQGTDQVLRYALDEVSGLILDSEPVVIAQRGQAMPNGQVLGELVDITWAPAGGDRRSSNLLILDGNGNVFQEDDAQGLQQLTIGGQDQWQSVRLISGYNGNLYALDQGAGRIWRYPPTADGYSGQPENYFEGDASLDLSHAVDMGIDGNIWILYGDGRLQSFLSGRQEPFELEPLPNQPLARPQALNVGPEAGTAQNLFIGEMGPGRIVEYGKDGSYQRQFIPADAADRDKLAGLRDLQVAEIDDTFYILTPQALYRTDIP